MLSAQKVFGDNFCVDKYSYIGNIRVLNSSNENVLIKKKSKYDLENVYKYLDDHHVTNYLKPIRTYDQEIVFPYLDKCLLTDDEKAKKMVYNLALWQSKTTIHQTIDLDKIKEIYETYQKKINYTTAYYQDLQDLIETKVYMAPVEYLLIRNISLIYQALQYSTSVLEQWYEIASNKKTQRKVFCHGKCELNHFLANDNGYFISLEKAHTGSVSEDFVSFYKCNYNQVDMISTFSFYQQKYPYQKDEELYFFLQISLPNIIEIYPASLKKCQELVNLFDYMKLTSDFLSDQQKQNKNH